MNGLQIANSEKWDKLTGLDEVRKQKQSSRGVLLKKVFLKILKNSQENNCARVFSCEVCEISKDTFLTEHLWTTVFMLVNWLLQPNSARW